MDFHQESRSISSILFLGYEGNILWDILKVISSWNYFSNSGPDFGLKGVLTGPILFESPYSEGRGLKSGFF